MITSGRRAKRPDGHVYRTMRRQSVSGRSLLETGRRRRHRVGGLRAAARSLLAMLGLWR